MSAATRRRLTLLLVAFALRLAWLGGASLWYDEAYLWWAASRLSLPHMVALSQYELIPPLHTLFLRGWIPLAGETEFALRYPTLLAGMVVVAAGAGLARRLVPGRRAEAWLLLLFAFAPPLLWASRELRMYGIALAFTLLGHLMMLDYLRTGERRYAWGWAAMVLCALSTVLTAIFWLVGEALFLLAVVGMERRPLPPLLRDLLPPFLLAAFLYLPWATGAAAQLGQNATYWPGYLPPATFWRIAQRALTTFGYGGGGEWAALLILGSAVAGWLGLLLHRRERRAALFLLTAMLPILLQMWGYRNIPKLSERHLILFVPPVVMGIGLLASELTAFPRRWAMKGAAGALTLLTLVLFLRADLDILGDPRHADWRSLATYVEHHRRPDDLVIIETGSVFPAWLYYADEEAMLPLPPDELLHVDHILTYGETAATLRGRLPPPGGSVWRVGWLESVSDPTDLVPALLSRVGEEEPTPDFERIGLRRFVIHEGAEALPETPPLTARLDAEPLPALHLIGYEARPPLRRDRPLDLWLWWETASPQAHEGKFYLLVLRLMDADGVEWGRANSTPGGGDFRPERWPVGEPVLGRAALEPLPWTPPGRYTLLATVSDGEASSTLTPGEIVLEAGERHPPLPVSAHPLTGTAGTLALRGLWLGQTPVAPCGTMEGTLYWETSAALPHPPTATLSLGATEQALSLLAPSAEVEAGTAFATRFALPVDCRALSGPQPLSLRCCGTPLPLAEVPVEADRTFILPEGVAGPEVPFGEDFAELAGYRLTPALPTAGQAFTLTLYWRAGQTADAPYSVFVHLLRADGSLAAQADAWPQQGAHPTNTWVEGEVIADPHPITALPAGRYRVECGLYAADGRRLSTPEGDTATWEIVVEP